MKEIKKGNGEGVKGFREKDEEGSWREERMKAEREEERENEKREIVKRRMEERRRRRERGLEKEMGGRERKIGQAKR